MQRGGEVEHIHIFMCVCVSGGGTPKKLRNQTNQTVLQTDCSWKSSCWRFDGNSFRLHGFEINPPAPPCPHPPLLPFYLPSSLFLISCIQNTVWPSGTKRRRKQKLFIPADSLVRVMGGRINSVISQKWFDQLDMKHFRANTASSCGCVSQTQTTNLLLTISCQSVCGGVDSNTVQKQFYGLTLVPDQFTALQWKSPSVLRSPSGGPLWSGVVLSHVFWL